MKDDGLLFAADLSNPEDIKKLKEIFGRKALDETMEEAKGDTHEFMRILKKKIWIQKLEENKKASIYADYRPPSPLTKQEKLF